MEGNSCFNPSGGPPCFDSSLTDPVYDYAHSGPNPGLQGNVVTGGYIYRGSVPALQGHYLFADFGSDNIWKIDPDAIDVEASVQRINSELVPDSGSLANIASFGEDDAGELYLMNLFNGQLFRIVTASKDVEWHGDDNSAGFAGDGTDWNDADNWTRGGAADQAFVAEDHVIFQPGSSQTQIDLQGNRTSSAVTFNAGYTLSNNTLTVVSGNITVNDSVTATIASGLSAETSNHSIRKLGAGTLQINGTAGQTVVKEGTLGGTGAVAHLTVQSGGNVAPGASSGILTVLNSYTQKSGGLLTVDIAGTAAGSGHDQINIAGHASLAGNLVIDTQFMPATGISPGQVGDMFEVMTFGSRSGEFESVVGRHAGGGVFYDVMLNASNISLGAWQALGGDTDGDRDRDITDFNALAANFDPSGGIPRDWPAGNFDDDNDVDITDFNQLAVNFSPLGYVSQVVPEPDAYWLLACGIALVGLVANVGHPSRA